MAEVPVPESVLETIPKPLVVPRGGAVAAIATLLCARDSRETSPKLTSKLGFFRPHLDLGVATGHMTHPDCVALAILDGMVLNPLLVIEKTRNQAKTCMFYSGYILSLCSAAFVVVYAE